MSMFGSKQRTNEELPIEQEIIQLDDSFNEFICVNAFLCEALTSVMSSNEPMKDEVIQGAKYCTGSLRSKSQELKEAIKHLRERQTETRS